MPLRKQASHSAAVAALLVLWLIGDCGSPVLASAVGGAPGPTARVTVSGRQLLWDGKPMHLKGVNWNPVPWGGTHPPSATDYQDSVERDAELLHQMGVNAVRTYTPMTDHMVLDKLWARGIWVINTVYGYAGQSPQQAAEYVTAVKDHPAILMWVSS